MSGRFRVLRTVFNLDKSKAVCMYMNSCLIVNFTGLGHIVLRVNCGLDPEIPLSLTKCMFEFFKFLMKFS